MCGNREIVAMLEVAGARSALDDGQGNGDPPRAADIGFRGLRRPTRRQA